MRSVEQSGQAHRVRQARGVLQSGRAAGADDIVRKAELTTELLPAIRRVMQAN